MTADDKLRHAAKIAALVPDVVSLANRTLRLCTMMMSRLRANGIDVSDIDWELASLTAQVMIERQKLDEIEFGLSGGIN